MKRTTRMHRAAWIVLMLPLVAIATTFQNCSKVDFATTVDASKSGAGEKKTMYQEAVVGQANVPPLKLIFIVDNSFTMEANQLNLAKSFASMFSGANATNLAPFDSTAYIFTTAQISLDKSNPAYNLLPTVSFDQMRSMKASDLMTMRGLASAQVDGKFAGDLVSYSVQNLPDPVTMLNRLSYVPTPVLGIQTSGADPISLGAHKDKSGSVSDFAADFTSRISYISPTRSKVNSAGQGPLDPVIDKESGLCALARVLKNNDNFLNKGDLAAFVIVSDENDNDPSGSKCIDAIQDFKDADLVDAHCETPRTKISYNMPNSNGPTCTFNFQKGFSYVVNYNALQTKVSFSNFYHRNTNAQTTVSYNTVSYKYTNYNYNVNYYVSNPTYSLKQVDVSWFTKSTSCKERDGVKYDCVESFSPQTATVEGIYSGGSCSAFAATYAGAVMNDAAHPITCKQGTPRTKIAGACPTSNANAFDCDAGYTAQTYSSIDDSNQVSCSTLISKLPSGALKSGVASQYLPQCAQPVAQTAGPIGGACPTGKTNCVETVSSKVSTKKVAVEYKNSNATCQAAIDLAKLPADAIKVLGASNGPTCASSNFDDPNLTIGKCSAPSGTIIACAETQQADPNGIVLSRMPSGQNCNQFAASSLPSSAVPGSATCTDISSATSLPGDVTYTASLYPGFNAVKDGACPAELASQVVSNYGAGATCKITSVATSPKQYVDTCANNSQNIAQFCTGANHACTTPTDNVSNVQQPYQTSVSTKIVNGTISCDMKCSDAYGACGAVTTGLVKDVYYNCSATADTKVSSNAQTGLLASKKDSLCAAPSELVVERSYQTSKPVPQHVAGSPSANGDPNALINYIKSRSAQLLGNELPATSVFVRQTDGGNGGTEGKAYKDFAKAMGGSNFDVTSSASVYASSLQNLSGVIKDKLARSFSIQGFEQGQTVTRAWFQAAGTTDWIEKQEGSEWTASGGTVTVSQSLDIHAGDSFRFEYK